MIFIKLVCFALAASGLIHYAILLGCLTGLLAPASPQLLTSAAMLGAAGMTLAALHHIILREVVKEDA